jgi:hypothetical protein
MRILTAIVLISGCVFLCVGSIGLWDGDTAGLVLWMPGALLMISGLIMMNRLNAKDNEDDETSEK